MQEMGATFEKPTHDESLQDRLKRNRRNRDRVLKTVCLGNQYQTDMNFIKIPVEAPLTDRNHFNQAMYCKKKLNLKSNAIQNSNVFYLLWNKNQYENVQNIQRCKRCHSDKNKIFSAADNMDPGILPPELTGLSLTEQQLIARISCSFA